MALWEYKVITSGKGGFATPQLLENFLNQLGKEEWEIVEFRSAPDNFLAFTGLARRGTQRDWTLEAAAAAQAKAEAEQRKAEERAAAVARERELERGGASAGGDSAAAAEPEPGLRDESFRRPRDTELDQDPEALADEAGATEVGDWDDLPEEDELPTLFEAVRPHLRRNQKGPGQSVAIDYLAKRWEQSPEDITGALLECGFTVPENEDSPPDYFEFEGDLYWLNKNNRGQLFLNVREKPRPAFRITPVRKLDPADPAAAELVAEHQSEVDRRAEQRRQQEAREAEKAARAEAQRAARAARQEAAAAAPTAEAAPAAGLPDGENLLATLRPRMRENRRGGGFSGSTAYLAKALRQPEGELVAALAALGLKLAETPGEKPEPVEIGENVYWLNKDSRGGIWINGRAKRDVAPAGDSSSAADAVGVSGPESADSAAGSAPAADRAATESPAGAAAAGADQAPVVQWNPGDPVFAVVRPLLQPNKRGSGASAEIDAIARATHRPVIEVIEALVAAGLSVPDDPKDKPVAVEFGEESFWISRNKDDSLSLQAKPRAARRTRGGRGRRKPDEGEAAGAEDAAAEGTDISSEPGEDAAAGPVENTLPTGDDPGPERA